MIRRDPGSVAPPICWTDNYIDATYRKVVAEIPDHQGLIADHFGVEIDEVRQIIRPILLTERAAAAISAEAGQPALEIVRQYLSVGRPVYISASQHPGDRFAYRMALKRGLRG